MSKQVERRKWDLDAYARKAADRRNRQEETESEPLPHGTSEKAEFQAAAADAAGPEGSQRAFLKSRGRVSGIDEQVGKTVVVAVEDAAGLTLDGVVTKAGVGWHCSVCKCFLKDSNAYFDHINGRRHQKALGFSMRVKRSTQSDVLAKLNLLTEQKEEEEAKKDQPQEVVDFQQLVRSKDEEEKRRKEERRRKRKERKNKAKEEAAPPKAKEEKVDGEDNEEEDYEEPGMDPDMAALMGFSGFGGGNKNG